MVVLDPSGAVKALVGGRSYRASPFDRAIKALRQPGSAFKPFVYLTALEAGYTPDSVADDEPSSINGWSPKNHRAPIAATSACATASPSRINTVAVRLAATSGSGA